MLYEVITRAWQKVLGEGFSHKKFNDLSFGQQRLLMIVRAVVKLPPLLILDEPTVGLDDENTALFYNLMHAITAQHQTAIVFVSHRAEPALRITSYNVCYTKLLRNSLVPKPHPKG